MNRKVTITIVALVFIISWSLSWVRPRGGTDFKDATYIIDGTPVTLVHGRAERPAAPGSASNIVTQYFGDEVETDINGDGRRDVVFLLTQDSGGSGTFFYVVAALNTPHGFVGTNAVFLGDRIAPQNIEASTRGLIVNYADRAPTDPMSTQPSIGKSMYLFFNANTGMLEQLQAVG